MRRILLALGIWLAAFVPAMAQAERMKISAFPSTLPEFIGGNEWWIYLDGPIERDTPARLEKLIQDRKIPGRSYVILNSPGGNLFAGMELGRIFRKYAFSTNVGQLKPGAKERHDTIPGGCYSSCSFAYLGGLFRYLQDGSIYGVHRFSFKEKTEFDSDLAQVASAEIVSYITSMGADPELFRLSTSAAASGMKELDKKTLERLNVVNNGRTKPVWSIESVEGMIYAKGERITAMSGMNKFMVICDNRTVWLHVIFSVQGREKELMAFSVHDLVTNSRDTSRLRLKHREIRNDLMNLSFHLRPDQISLILSAREVGVSVRLTEEAGVFFGFDDMPIAEGREKVNGVVRNCR